MKNDTTRSTKAGKVAFSVTYEGPRGGRYTKRGDALQMDADRLLLRSRGKWYGIACYDITSTHAAGIELYTKTAGGRFPSCIAIYHAVKTAELIR